MKGLALNPFRRNQEINLAAETHFITREIGIDMGHRVTYHGSKCRNLHGHRYTIFATCEGPLYTDGEQQGMVLDFGFLKEEMMAEIDEPCDHGTCLWIDDPLLSIMVPKLADQLNIRERVEKKGYQTYTGSSFGKLYLVSFVPTAENLAKHWADRLTPRILDRTEGQARLHGVKVYETPNCSAEYLVPKEA